MLWAFGGDIYRFDRRLADRPDRAADRDRGQVVRRGRLSDLSAGTARDLRGVAIVIGVGLWLALNRTRVGMMIRAGVDDRDMLAASGVNVQLVFAVMFAIGAGLAGFAGVVGGTALSISPGEDTRYLLASLVVVIVGGMGIDRRRRDRRAADRPRRAVRPRLRADLRRRLHLRDHGASRWRSGRRASWRGADMALIGSDAPAFTPRPAGTPPRRAGRVGVAELAPGGLGRRRDPADHPLVATPSS